MPPVQVEKVFDSHYECAYQGYSLSAEMIKGLGEKQVNRDKIYFNFSCKEIGSL
jgi:hypothetical protein